MVSDLVYLVQTDTTVGFSSSNDEKLSSIKQRPNTQKILQTVDSFKTLNINTRVPKKFRKRIRNSNKSTYIYPNMSSFRVIHRDSPFYPFISKFKALYSTSANKSGENFDENFAKENSDIIITTRDDFNERTSSSIYKVNKKRIIKIR